MGFNSGFKGLIPTPVFEELSEEERYKARTRNNYSPQFPVLSQT